MKQQIEVAAKWWADQLRASAKHADVFEQVLREMLVGYLAARWNARQPRFGAYLRVLSCDYGPDGLLKEAAVSAGIRAKCPPFPMKTTMWVDPDRVWVRCGYGAETEVLWSAAAGTEPVEATDDGRLTTDKVRKELCDELVYLVGVFVCAGGVGAGDDWAGGLGGWRQPGG